MCDIATTDSEYSVSEEISGDESSDEKCLKKLQVMKFVRKNVIKPM